MVKGIMNIFQTTAVQAADQANGLNGAIALQDPGMKLISFVTLGICLLTIILIIYKIIFLRKALEGISTRRILLIVFVILSPMIYFISFFIGIEKSKPVEFCNSCHIMNNHVENMLDPDSESIAALHYQYRWIADKQCYTCHSDYGLFGAGRAKYDGISHILHYYVLGYEEKLHIKGTYNNERCLFCHATVAAYQDIEEHQDYAEEIKTSKQSCFGVQCHVSPHPDEIKELAELRRSK